MPRSETDLPAVARTAGITNAGPWYASPGTRGNDTMLIVVMRGKGVHRRRGGNVALRSGMLGLAVPEDPGQLIADPDDPFSYAYCRFNGTWATTEAAAVRTGWVDGWQTNARTAPILARLKLMGPVHRSALPTRMGQRECLLIEILLRLADAWEVAAPAPLTADGLTAFLHDRIDRPSDLPGFAKELGISPSHLSRSCQRLTGSTVLALHQAIKLAWARELLSQGDPVAVVARRVGFEDPTYFSRVFRRKLGRSPSAWRRQGDGSPGVDSTSDPHTRAGRPSTR